MKREFRRGFGFIEIIIVVAAILFVIYKMVNLYTNNMRIIDKRAEKALSEQGLDESDVKAIENSTRQKLEGIQKEHMKQLEEVK